jgi:hypothetical protein
MRESIMSRAYRIKVSESLNRVIRASDHVSTQLEVMEILPREQMADLLAEELLRRGFQLAGKALVREGNGITLTVDPETGTVTAQVEASKQAQVQRESEGRAYDQGPGRKRAEEALRRQLREELEKQVEQQNERLQKEVTDRLEGELVDLRKELNQVVNRVTAEALKRKAAQIGQIKEMTEDPQSGSMTIVLEV